VRARERPSGLVAVTLPVAKSTRAAVCAVAKPGNAADKAAAISDLGNTDSFGMVDSLQNF